MKFVSIKSNIKEILSALQRASGENTNLPILKNTFIEAKNNIITLTATNLEIAITARVSGKIIEDGQATIQTSVLANLINNLQSDRINFEKKGDNLEIKTDNYSALLQGLPAADFPVTPGIENTKQYLEIKALFLREAIQQVITASQFSDLRPELNSILFDFSLETLKIAATDGFRLSEKSLPANSFTSKFTEPFRILIPLKTAQEISRIFADDELVRIFRDENQILCKTEKIELISRLHEGNFPDYSSIIPKSFAAEITVNREEFSNAIKLAGVFSQRNNELKIAIHPQKKAIEVTSADQSLGENSYLLPAKIKGEALEVFFNTKYLLDAARSITGEDLFLGFQQDTNPALIKSFSDSSYFYILKPILKA
jgi:DNA polymerase-3 subunit beta